MSAHLSSPGYSAYDEGRHPVGPDPLWQESVVMVWWDDAQGVGGFHRIGHEPQANDGAGCATAWTGIVTRDGQRYVRYLNETLHASDTKDQQVFAVGAAIQARFIDEQSVWIIADTDCNMRLVAETFTPRFDLFRGGGAVTDEFAPGHLEAAGTVRGQVQLGDRSIEIDGLCFRDHSWGRRDWSSLLSHRWVAGTCGPKFSFNATSWHGVDGSLRSFGIVLRDGEVVYADAVDIVTYMEIDGLTHRGGLVRLDMPDGEQLSIELSAVDGVMTMHNGTAWVDEICTFEHDAMRGFADFSISNNPRAGRAPIMACLRAAHEPGLSRRL